MQQDDENRPNENARARNISRGLGSLALQSIITSILAYVFLVVLIRMVSYTDYTAYSSVFVLITIAVIVSTFGLQYAGARYVALFVSEDSGSSLSKAWNAAKTVMVVSLIFSAASALVFALLSSPFSDYFMKSEGPHYVPLFELGALFLFVYSYSTVLQSVVSGLKRYVLLAKMLTISRALMLLFTIVGLLLTQNVAIAVLAWVVYYSILIAWPFQIIARELIHRSRNNDKKIVVGSRIRSWISSEIANRSYYSLIMRYTFPLAISAIFLVVSTGGDSIILGHYTPSLGAYSVSVNISAVLNLVLVVPLTTALLPEVSSSLKSQAEISNGARLSVRFLMLALLPASFLMAALSSQLINAFSGGGTYLQGVGPLQLIAFTYILAGITLAMYSLLQAVGRTVEALILSAILAGIDLSLAIILVPQLGILGAALTKSIVALVGMALGFYFARNYLKGLDSGSFYFRCVLAAAIPAAAIFFLSFYVSDRTITIIPYSIVGAALFLGCIKWFKVLNEEDRNFLAHFLPRALQKLTRYL